MLVGAILIGYGWFWLFFIPFSFSYNWEKKDNSEKEVMWVWFKHLDYKQGEGKDQVLILIYPPNCQQQGTHSELGELPGS